jgi:hypothetical protein
MSCSHHHRAEVLAQGLASLSTLHVSLKPKRKKASHNRCSTIACGPFCSHKDVKELLLGKIPGGSLPERT